MTDTKRPRCGDCIHLKEKATSESCSFLWCDIPMGNRKASRDVGGCDYFKNKDK